MLLPFRQQCESSNGGGIDLSLVGRVEHVAQVDHVALCAPLDRQTLGAFHDHVGSLVRRDRGVDLVVAVAAVGQAHTVAGTTAPLCGGDESPSRLTGVFCASPETARLKRL